MYSKTRNSLTALATAALFLASTWMLGQPLRAEQALAHTGGNGGTTLAVVPSASSRLDPSTLRAHHSLRLRLAMPYYSFSLTTFDRGVD